MDKMHKGRQEHSSGTSCFLKVANHLDLFLCSFSGRMNLIILLCTEEQLWPGRTAAQFLSCSDSGNEEKNPNRSNPMYQLA